MNLPAFSLQDVARYCRVNQLTVEKWIEQGRLHALPTRNSGYVVPRSEFRAFLKMNGLPVDALFFATGGRPKRVLVITNSQSLVQFVVESLCRASVAIEVVSAADRHEAECQATASSPDLVVLGDAMRMDERLGLCRWLRDKAAFERTRILAIVDAGSEDTRRRLLFMEVDEVAKQPLDAGSFWLQVYALLMDSSVLRTVPAGVSQRPMAL